MKITFSSVCKRVLFITGQTLETCRLPGSTTIIADLFQMNAPSHTKPTSPWESKSSPLRLWTSRRLSENAPTSRVYSRPKPQTAQLVDGKIMRVLPRRVLSSALLAVSALLICLLNLGIVTWHAATTHPSSKSLSPGSLLHHNDRGLKRFPKRLATTTVNSSFVPRYREPKPRPPLESIVQGWNITGDPSWLLNFAIVGFPKCGTSTLMFHLQNHPEIQIFGDERCEMSFNQQVRLINDLYHKFPPGDYARAIKCPMDLESTKLSMRNYIKFFPNTDFIVEIRHPVLWYVQGLLVPSKHKSVVCS